jgi:hypothetical protein
VVLQLCNYTGTFSTAFGHHQALAGGASTSQLPTETSPSGVVFRDEVEVPPAEAWWCPKGVEKVAV